MKFSSVLVLLSISTTASADRSLRGGRSLWFKSPSSSSGLACGTQSTCESCIVGTSSIASLSCKWDGNACWSRSYWWKGGSTRCPTPAPAPAPAPAQPDLDPASWFLSTSELTRARGGHARGDLHTFSSGNRVELLADGKSTFAKWRSEVEGLATSTASAGGFAVVTDRWAIGNGYAVRADRPTPEACAAACRETTGCVNFSFNPGSLGCRTGTSASPTGYQNHAWSGGAYYVLTAQPFVYHSGWMVGDASLPLVPDVDGTVTLGATLTNAIGRGAQALVLSWANAFEFPALQTLRAAVAVNAGATGSSMELDTRVGHPTGTLHQKLSAFRRDDGEVVAMVGGVDLTYERWDTVGHDADASRASTTKGATSGWVDRHLHIRGPAAADVANTFAQRWNDDALPNPDVSAAQWTAAGHDVPTAPHATASAVGTHHVQSLRTYGCGYLPYTELVTKFGKTGGVTAPGTSRASYPYAPRGETTVLAALVKAIGNAKSFIYLEDQYGLYVEEIKDALAAALAKPSFQKLVVVQQDVSETDAGKFKCMASWYAMWQTLSAGHPGKVQLYHRADGSYVHSKTWVFDDALFVTGSANVNRRSFTHDAEFDMAVIDATQVTSADGVRVGKFVHDARLAMWSEHTLLSADTLRGMTIAEAAAAFDASGAVKRVAFDSDDDSRPDLEVCELSDPSGLC